MPSRRTSAAGAGPGTPDRRGGCIGPGSSLFSGSGYAASGSWSTPVSRMPGRGSRWSFAIAPRGTTSSWRTPGGCREGSRRWRPTALLSTATSASSSLMTATPIASGSSSAEAGCLTGRRGGASLCRGRRRGSRAEAVVLPDPVEEPAARVLTLDALGLLEQAQAASGRCRRIFREERTPTERDGRLGQRRLNGVAGQDPAPLMIELYQPPHLGDRVSGQAFSNPAVRGIS